jgi:hypothetical protein
VPEHYIRPVRSREAHLLACSVTRLTGKYDIFKASFLASGWDGCVAEAMAFCRWPLQKYRMRAALDRVRDPQRTKVLEPSPALEQVHTSELIEGCSEGTVTP